MEEYGSIHAINLLGQKENEASLTNAYARHLQTAREALGDELNITHFDFHNVVRFGGHESVIRDIRFVSEHSSDIFTIHEPLTRTMESIADHVDQFGFTMCDATSDEIITDQKGAFRANCLDWSVVFLPSFAFIEQFKQVLTAPTSFRIFYLDSLWSNICFLFDVNGYTRTHFGLIIVNYGPKMVMPYPESTLGQVL